MEKDLQTIAQYIDGFPQEIQSLLEELRSVIKEEAPEAEETISYQLPTFKLHGNLIHFGAFKNHIGLYPTPSGMEQFKDALSAYETAKGSVKFPLNQPLPWNLIREIVRFRLKENREKAQSNSRKPKKRD
ncbi:MAG: DUF1801 domain-containing protein [Haliscomenobacter sp.]|nr:DUF1801 domain-containing protein [Haliscomenobacter sp.]MBK8878474.1 DUF1801 domain-containing protein [Haliscomenobacter sp.]